MGDKLTVIVNGGQVIEVPITAEILKDGYKTTAPRPQDGETVDAKATIKDQAGNESAAGQDKATVGDTTAPSAPTVVITTDLDNDGILSNTELDNKTEVTITVTVPADAKVGDTLNVIVNGGQAIEVTITAEILKDGYKTTVPRPQDGETVDAKATIKDQAGNESAPGQDQATVGDTTAPSAPTVVIETDSNDDGILSLSLIHIRSDRRYTV